MTNKQKRRVLDAIEDILAQLGLRCDECRHYDRYNEYRGTCRLTHSAEAASSYCDRWCEL